MTFFQKYVIVILLLVFVLIVFLPVSGNHKINNSIVYKNEACTFFKEIKQKHLEEFEEEETGEEEENIKLESEHFWPICVNIIDSVYWINK